MAARLMSSQKSFSIIRIEIAAYRHPTKILQHLEINPGYRCLTFHHHLFLSRLRPLSSRKMQDAQGPFMQNARNQEFKIPINH
jgi:hypothetical protein